MLIQTESFFAELIFFQYNSGIVARMIYCRENSGDSLPVLHHESIYLSIFVCFLHQCQFITHTGDGNFYLSFSKIDMSSTDTGQIQIKVSADYITIFISLISGFLGKKSQNLKF